MSSLDSTNDRPSRRHTHKPNGIAADPKCPTCLQSVTPEVFLRIAGQQRANDAEIERAVESRFAREIARMQTARKGEVARAVKEATTVADAKIKAIVSNQDATIAAHLGAEREKTAKAVAQAVAATKIEHAAEKHRLEAALSALQTKLAAKPAHMVGEPAEIDLHQKIAEMLAESAPEDVCRRVGRGVRGADVIVEVMHRGEVAGKLIIESKAHAKWQSSFTRKLRENVIREGAAFGILSSPVLWSGAPQHLALRDGVICASPERVPVLVALLRQIVVDNHVQRLGAEQRNSKADMLYAFLLSRRCDAMFDGLLKLTRDLVAMDTTETRAHVAVWAKRAELVQGVIAIREQFVAVVADIIGGGQ